MVTLLVSFVCFVHYEKKNNLFVLACLQWVFYWLFYEFLDGFKNILPSKRNRNDSS